MSLSALTRRGLTARSRGLLLSFEGVRGLPWLVRASHNTSGGGRNNESLRHTSLPKLVIFDKNGTLTNCNRYWAPWARALAQKLESTTGLNLEDKVLESLEECQLKPGESPPDRQVKGILQKLLRNNGFRSDTAKLLVDISWVDCDKVSYQNKESGLIEAFEALKSHGIKLAVSTSEDRTFAEVSLAEQRILSYIDAVQCRDETEPSKLYFSKLQGLCEGLEVMPQESAFIADESCDMLSGKQAGLGLVIGVLSGQGTRLDLAPHADEVVNNVIDAVKVLDKFWLEAQMTESRGRARTRQKQDFRKKPSLVIFHKDGTMVCFKALWSSWAKNVLKELEETTGLDLHDPVLEELGYHSNMNRQAAKMFVTPGNRPHVLSELKDLLFKEGLDEDHVSHVLHRVATHKQKGLTSGYSPPIDTPAALFKILQTHGVKVVVYASDSRWKTKRLLESLWADSFVDMLLCVDDLNGAMRDHFFDHPGEGEDDIAVKVCKILNINPEETVIVGEKLDEGDFTGSRSHTVTVRRLRERSDVQLPIVLVTKREGLVVIREKNWGISLPKEEQVEVIPRQETTQHDIVLREANLARTALIQARLEQKFIAKARLICTAVWHALKRSHNNTQNVDKQPKDLHWD